MTQLITNPSAAFQKVSDFLTYEDDSDNLLDYPRVVDTFIAAGTIAKNDWVGFVGASATAALKVEKLDVSDAFAATVCIGVALEGAAAGDRVQVVTRGVAICNINDTGTIALGDVAVKHATADGASGVTAIASLDATVVAGSILGIYLGPEIGTTGFAPVWVQKI